MISQKDTMNKFLVRMVFNAPESISVYGLDPNDFAKTQKTSWLEWPSQHKKVYQSTDSI